MSRRGVGALRALALVTGATYISYAAGLLSSTLVARTLGPSEYGQYAYIVWLWGTLVMLMNNGLTTATIRFVSESRGREDAAGAASLHRWFSHRQWASIAIVSVVFGLSLPLVQPAGWSGHLLLFGSVAVLASITKARYLFDVSVAKGYGRFDIEAASVVAMCVLNVVGVVALWWAGAGLGAFLVLFVLVSLAHPVMVALQSRAAGIRAGGEAPPQEMLARVRTQLFWTIVLAFAGAFSNKAAETFLLNRFAGPEAVAFFTIAGALARGGVDLLSSGLTTLLMPTMARAYGAGGDERVNRIAADALRYCHFLGMLLLGVGLLWAQPLVHAMYGSGYEPAVPVLQALVVVGGLTMSNGALGALLSITDRQRARAYVVIASVLLSFATAAALVPGFGLQGAVLSHALSSLMLLAVVALVVVRSQGLRLPYASLGRLTGAGLIAALPCVALVMLWPGDIAHVVAGGLYALLFMPLTARLRAWQPQDLRFVQPLAQKLPLLRRWIPPAPSDAAS